MSRTLVIPDIHHRVTQAQILIDNVAHDRVVLLGDYFDNFSDSVYDTHNTATWLKNLVLTNPKITPLIGNHDINYFWPDCTFLRCSGFTEPKLHAIQAVLTYEEIRKFKFFTTDQGYVLSHAGFTNQLWKEYKKYQGPHGTVDFGGFITAFQSYVDKGVEQLDLMRSTPIFAAGWDRGGLSKYGGINWVDWTNFAPIKGINQIVGHTPVHLPNILIQKTKGTIKTYSAVTIEREKHSPFEGATSVNYALDTHSLHFAVIEDGRVDIYDTATRKTIKELMQKNLLKDEELDEVELAERAKQAYRYGIAP